jgi:hypothetical protein
MGAVLFALNGREALRREHSADFDVSRDYGFAMRAEAMLLHCTMQASSSSPSSPASAAAEDEFEVPRELTPVFFVRRLRLERVAHSIQVSFWVSL